jgi:hypothetical protein
MKRAVVAFFLIILQCGSKPSLELRTNATTTAKSSMVESLDSLIGDSLLGFYSNMEVDTEETGDCSGYTIMFKRDSSHKLATSFVAHEGSCNIAGFALDSLTYSKARDSLSFLVPFEGNVGVSYYKFKGKISVSSLQGNLRIIYPNDSLNTSEVINLRKQDSLFERKFAPPDRGQE